METINEIPPLFVFSFETDILHLLNSHINKIDFYHMTSESLPKYLLLNENSDELKDKRISIKKIYVQSSTGGKPEQQIIKRINNTLSLPSQPHLPTSLYNLAYSNKHGLLIQALADTVMLTSLRQFEQELIQGDIKRQGKAFVSFSGQLFLSPSEDLIAICSDSLIQLAWVNRLPNMDGLPIPNTKECTRFMWIDDSTFVGWRFEGGVTVFKLDQQLRLREQIELQIQFTTAVSLIADNLLVTEKLKVSIFDVLTLDLKKQIDLKIEDHQCIYFEYSVIADIFRINVHSKSGDFARLNAPFSKDDIFCLVLVYYDQDKQDRPFRYLTFLRGNLLSDDPIQHRGNEAFYTTKDSEELYYIDDDVKCSIACRVEYSGQFISLMIEKSQIVYVIDPMEQFDKLNICAMESKHQLKDHTGKFFQGIALMKNMLEIQRKCPPEGDLLLKQICGTYNGQFMSLFFSAKQTDLTISFPPCIIALAGGKLYRRYAISTINGIDLSKNQQILAEIKKIKISPFVVKVEEQWVLGKEGERKDKKKKSVGKMEKKNQKKIQKLEEKEQKQEKKQKEQLQTKVNQKIENIEQKIVETKSIFSQQNPSNQCVNSLFDKNNNNDNPIATTGSIFGVSDPTKVLIPAATSSIFGGLAPSPTSTPPNPPIFGVTTPITTATYPPATGPIFGGPTTPASGSIFFAGQTPLTPIGGSIFVNLPGKSQAPVQKPKTEAKLTQQLIVKNQLKVQKTQALSSIFLPASTSLFGAQNNNSTLFGKQSNPIPSQTGGLFGPGLSLQPSKSNGSNQQNLVKKKQEQKSKQQKKQGNSLPIELFPNTSAKIDLNDNKGVQKLKQANISKVQVIRTDMQSSSMMQSLTTSLFNSSKDQNGSVQSSFSQMNKPSNIGMPAKPLSQLKPLQTIQQNKINISGQSGSSLISAQKKLVDDKKKQVQKVKITKPYEQVKRKLNKLYQNIKIIKNQQKQTNKYTLKNAKAAADKQLTQLKNIDQKIMGRSIQTLIKQVNILLQVPDQYFHVFTSEANIKQMQEQLEKDLIKNQQILNKMTSYINLMRKKAKIGNMKSSIVSNGDFSNKIVKNLNRIFDDNFQKIENMENQNYKILEKIQHLRREKQNRKSNLSKNSKSKKIYNFNTFEAEPIEQNYTKQSKPVIEKKHQNPTHIIKKFSQIDQRPKIYLKILEEPKTDILPTRSNINVQRSQVQQVKSSSPDTFIGKIPVKKQKVLVPTVEPIRNDLKEKDAVSEIVQNAQNGDSGSDDVDLMPPVAVRQISYVQPKKPNAEKKQGLLFGNKNVIKEKEEPKKEEKQSGLFGLLAPSKKEGEKIQPKKQVKFQVAKEGQVKAKPTIGSIFAGGDGNKKQAEVALKKIEIKPLNQTITVPTSTADKQTTSLGSAFGAFNLKKPDAIEQKKPAVSEATTVNAQLFSFPSTKTAESSLFGGIKPQQITKKEQQSKKDQTTKPDSASQNKTSIFSNLTIDNKKPNDATAASQIFGPPKPNPTEKVPQIKQVPPATEGKINNPKQQPSPTTQPNDPLISKPVTTGTFKKEQIPKVQPPKPAIVTPTPIIPIPDAQQQKNGVVQSAPNANNKMFNNANSMLGANGENKPSFGSANRFMQSDKPVAATTGFDPNAASFGFSGGQKSFNMFGAQQKSQGNLFNGNAQNPQNNQNGQNNMFGGNQSNNQQFTADSQIPNQKSFGFPNNQQMQNPNQFGNNQSSFGNGFDGNAMMNNSPNSFSGLPNNPMNQQNNGPNSSFGNAFNQNQNSAFGSQTGFGQPSFGMGGGNMLGNSGNTGDANFLSSFKPGQTNTIQVPFNATSHLTAMRK